MRWEALFADLEAEFSAAEAAELSAEVADRTRLEMARLHLADRLRSGIGRQVALTVLGAGSLRGRLCDVGPNWLLLAEETGREVLVPAAGVLGVVGLTGAAADPGTEGLVAARFDFRLVVRRLARSRAEVQVFRMDGAVLGGTVDRVGADYLEVAEHPAGEPRRGGEVRQRQLVPFAAVAAVRSLP